MTHALFQKSKKPILSKPLSCCMPCCLAALQEESTHQNAVRLRSRLLCEVVAACSLAPGDRAWISKESEVLICLHSSHQLRILQNRQTSSASKRSETKEEWSKMLVILSWPKKNPHRATESENSIQPTRQNAADSSNDFTIPHSPECTRTSAVEFISTEDHSRQIISRCRSSTHARSFMLDCVVDTSRA